MWSNKAASALLCLYHLGRSGLGQRSSVHVAIHPPEPRMPDAALRGEPALSADLSSAATACRLPLLPLGSGDCPRLPLLRTPARLLLLATDLRLLLRGTARLGEGATAALTMLLVSGSATLCTCCCWSLRACTPQQGLGTMHLAACWS